MRDEWVNDRWMDGWMVDEWMIVGVKDVLE